MVDQSPTVYPPTHLFPLQLVLSYILRTMSTFTPRNAIVTGAADGIGKGIALRLAADGLNVVVNDLPEKQALLDELVKELEAKGVKATSFACDITGKNENIAIVEKCVNDFGSLDVMVCNAGTAFIKPLLDTSFEEVQNLLDVNLKSVFHGYKAAAEQMIKQGNGGRIIGAASAVAKKGFPFMSAYSASKFAVRGLTQSAAQELGEHGIIVNAYCPGIIWTPLIQTLGAQLSSVVGQPGADPREMWAKSCALRRVGAPSDVAGLVSWLASADNGFITGQSFNIDGGSLFD